MADNVKVDYIKQIELVQGDTDPKIINIGIPHMLPITYGDISTYVSNGALVEGVWYRITDYQCTVAQSITVNGNVVKLNVGSSRFDVVVPAISKTELGEEGFAIKSDDAASSNVADKNLMAWRIWYSWKNDTNRFNWANASGKGVIYRMIDEWGNDCPYDFKNIMFGETLRYTFDNGSSSVSDSSLNGVAKNNTLKPYYSGTTQIFNNVRFVGSSIDNNVVESNCNNITFGSYSYALISNVMESECKFLNIHSNTSGVNVQNVHIEKGTSGTQTSPLEITGFEGKTDKQLNIGQEKGKTDEVIIWYL